MTSRLALAAAVLAAATSACGPASPPARAARTGAMTQAECGGACTWDTEIEQCLCPVETTPGCTLTQGYWKTHGFHGPAAFDDAWLLVGPAADDTLFAISGLTYHEVLVTPPKGNAWYSLAHQYIAAKLNVLNGADGSAVAASLDWAERFFAAHGPGYRFSPSMAPILGSTVEALDAFDSGAVGPGHCGDEPL